jgi:hypothetical protein
VKVSSLRLGESPRLVPEDPAHAQALAEIDANALPPVLVRAKAMTVVDGWHLVLAARIRGEKEIRARMLQVGEEEAFFIAVRSNAIHGKPLSLAERLRAASRLLESQLVLSDRAIAGACALSNRTVARQRKARALASPRTDVEPRGSPAPAQYTGRSRRGGWADECVPRRLEPQDRSGGGSFREDGARRPASNKGRRVTFALTAAEVSGAWAGIASIFIGHFPADLARARCGQHSVRVTTYTSVAWSLALPAQGTYFLLLDQPTEVSFGDAWRHCRIWYRMHHPKRNLCIFTASAVASMCSIVHARCTGFARLSAGNSQDLDLALPRAVEWPSRGRRRSRRSPMP